MRTGLPLILHDLGSTCILYLNCLFFISKSSLHSTTFSPSHEPRMWRQLDTQVEMARVSMFAACLSAVTSQAVWKIRSPSNPGFGCPSLSTKGGPYNNAQPASWCPGGSSEDWPRHFWGPLVKYYNAVTYLQQCQSSLISGSALCQHSGA